MYLYQQASSLNNWPFAAAIAVQLATLLELAREVGPIREAHLALAGKPLHN